MIVKAKKLCFIIFILVFLQTTLCYKYNFSQFSGSSVCNQDNAACTPQFVSGYNGYGTGIMKLRQGVMILPGTVVSTNSGMNQGSTGTLCFTVFIFNVNQLSTLYTVTSTGTRNSYLNFKINNGKMRIESGTYNSGSYNASPTKETSSSSMYSTGWNLICYTLSNTNFNFYSYPRFTTSVVSESATNTTFETNNGFIGIFGGLINSAGTSFSNSFQGIIHTIDIQSTTYTSTSIASNFLVPTSSPFTICDYYIGMFTNLSVQDAFNAFTNLMYNHYSQTQQFTNSLSSTVDSNGLAFSNGQTQSITNVKVTSQRAIGVQLWVMGGFTNNAQISSIAKDSSNKGAYVYRFANNIIVGTTYSGTTITFSNAVTSLSNSGWILIGFSIGWMGTNNDFMLCGYIYQPSSTYESGDCAASISISTTDFGSGVTLYVELGSGISGYVREVYITNHLEHSHILQLFKNTFGVTRYDCYEEFNYDPHYIRQGCGNGHILSTESSEQCDDGNTSSSDGCSSSCTIENLYKCVNTVGLSPVTTCTFTCGNANYESQYAEGCDDGNTSSNDGCSSLCAVETGWTCTNVAGSKSTCSAICGDGKRLGAEACDDGNISDNQGCKPDCTGSINGWHCSGGSSTTADTCSQQCNDGYITLSEQCEDGNTSNGDGCSSTCQTEAGWSCTNNAGLTSTTCVSICGDGKRVGSETCDDGNTSDNQGCKSDCSGMINGWHCSGGTATTADICAQQCNDGYITVSEQCEDGNTSNGDGCSSTCQTEAGWSCTNNAGMTFTTCTSICGDGNRAGSEACDDGNISDNQGCKSDCTGSINGWHCSGGNPTTADTCTQQCNDGYITVNEQCEDGNTSNGDGCSSTCQTETGWTCTNNAGLTSSTCSAICGDGKRLGTEVCDDGNTSDNQGCKSDCTGMINGWHCSGGTATTADTCTQQCNDGHITVSEQCEDGNTSNGDGCSSTCQTETGWTCTNNAGMTSTTCVSICGDGKRVGSEACDDGNTSDNQGCKSDCTGMINGWHCSGGTSTTADTCTQQCNDGYITVSEQCEDGNSSSGDGCSSTCQTEVGWTCTNNAAMTSTTCIPICGDGKKVGSEACDDGNTSDNQGCKSDCTGMINGWHCSGGNPTTADTCTEQCNDGYITANEQCEDANLSNGDGCSSTCSIEVGWTCVNNAAMTTSVCTVICGDGFIKGKETCDDGDSSDSRGCTSDCKGILKGWYCSSSKSPDSVCVSHCGDGIHVSFDEGCDDGNSVNSGDGCTNSCTIEDKWDCSDDILQRSLCVSRCGNGKRNGSDETCDDANIVDGDGCSSKCLIESGWQCFNGTSTTADNCYKQPVASIDSVSSNNIVKVKFSEKIKNFQPQNNSSYTIAVSGPYSPYQFTVSANFINEYTLSFKLTFASQMFGQNQETIKITFTQSEFLSNNGASLYNSYLETSLNKVSLTTDAVSAMGSSINNAMSVSIVVMIASNLLLGQSSELLWGFLSTIQIIYFFPLLNLYFPDNFSSLLACFSASTLQLPIPSSFSLQSNIESQTNLSDKLNMPALNDRYESLNYQSTSILLTGGNIFNIFTQGIVVCIIVYGFRAILFTLRVDSTLYEEELNKIERSNQIQIVENNNSENIKPKESKLRILIKKKIKEMSCEYKYNFFLRTGGQVFLEASIVSLLNIRYMQVQNFYQVLSIIVSFAFLGGLLLFYVWSIRFACIHYNDYKYREKIDIPEYESMFSQYKTKHLPQSLFNTYFMTRRILYACIIVFLIDFPEFQAFTFMLICLPILAYHITMNPYISKINNIVMNINEFSFVFIGTTFYIFSEPMSNTNQQTILGWVDICIIMSVCIFNFIVLWSLKIIMTYYQLKEWWQAFKEKQRLKKIKKLREYRGTNENLQNEASNIPEFYTMRCTRENELLPPQVLNSMKIKPSQFYRLNNMSQRSNM